MSEKYYLEIPYFLKDRAKALGTKWDPDLKKFYITDSSKCGLFENVYLKVPYDQREVAKLNGCRWNNEKRCWVSLKFNEEFNKQYETIEA